MKTLKTIKSIECLYLTSKQKSMKYFLTSLLLILLLADVFGNTFIVTNTNASGAGSFIEAIDNSNINSGKDSITFNISGMPPHEILLTVTSSIMISDSLLIDGTTQPDNGHTGSCPKIVINASGVGPITILFHLMSPEVYISGLWIKNLTNPGSFVIYATSAKAYIGAPGKKNVFTNVVNSIAVLNNDIEISSNYFGCNCDGTALEANSGDAIISYSTFSNLAITDNLISGNVTGIRLGSTSSASTNLIITGNKIGTDITGTAALGNILSGIELININSLVLGGPGHNEGNVISGNGNQGCLLTACSGIVQGNKVGTDISGNDSLPNDPLNTQYNSSFNCNGYSGITCSLTIGGSGPGEKNIFYGNDIALNIADSSGHYEVINNLIGLTATGLVSSTQSYGFQLYYDTNRVSLENNIIFGYAAGVYATHCKNFYSEGNLLGRDSNNIDLSMTNGYSLSDVDSFTIINNVIRNCDQGMIIIDCNDSYIGMNNIQNCITPIVLRTSNETCHHNQLFRNILAFNFYTVNINNGFANAANDDILPPIIEGSNSDSTWGSSLPNAAIDLCYDTTLLQLDPQGYNYSIPRLYADASGHWMYAGFLDRPNELTAVQTDLNNNSSTFSSRLTLGIDKISLNMMKVYPNPVMDYIVIENHSGVELNHWQLFNSIGTQVEEGDMNDLSHQQINVKHLAPGSYFLKIYTDGESILKKCIKL